jgi:DNA-binding LacI/PurR family transcriptional regulator
LQLANKANIPVILVGFVEQGEGKPISLIDFDFKDMGRAASEVAQNEGRRSGGHRRLAGMNVAEPITAGLKRNWPQPEPENRCQAAR